MHSFTEYSELLKQIVDKAAQMVSHLSDIPFEHGKEILYFIKHYGCEGYPSDKERDFFIGPWIGRPDTPIEQHQGVAIIPYFSDDKPLTELVKEMREKGQIALGHCLYADQVIGLTNVDHWSLTELALALLHEGRHARHRIGPKIGNLPPLDENGEWHETYTWMFVLSTLADYKNKEWVAAVQKEVDWLESQNPRSPSNQIEYMISQHYWPELEQVFGPAKHETAKIARRYMASMQAHMIYWPRRNQNFRPANICRAIINHFDL